MWLGIGLFVASVSFLLYRHPPAVLAPVLASVGGWSLWCRRLARVVGKADIGANVPETSATSGKEKEAERKRRLKKTDGDGELERKKKHVRIRTRSGHEYAPTAEIEVDAEPDAADATALATQSQAAGIISTATMELGTAVDNPTASPPSIWLKNTTTTNNNNSNNNALASPGPHNREQQQPEHTKPAKPKFTLSAPRASMVSPSRPGPRSSVLRPPPAPASAWGGRPPAAVAAADANETSEGTRAMATAGRSGENALMPPPLTPASAARARRGFTSTAAPPRDSSSSSSLMPPLPRASASPLSSSLAPPTLTPSLGPPRSAAAAARAPPRPRLAPGHSPLDWARLAADPSQTTRLVGHDAMASCAVLNRAAVAGANDDGDDGNDPGIFTYLPVVPSRLQQQNGRRGRDAWTSFRGRVYHIGAYVPFHPGGASELLRCAGRDGEGLFAEVHPWVNWEGVLGGCCVGVLVGEDGGVRGKGKGLEEMD